MQIIDFNTNGYSFKPGGGGSSAKLGTTNLYPDTVSNVYMAEDEGLDGWSSVIVEGVDASIDGNILPENIKKGVKILRVEGTLEEGDYDEIYDEIVNLNAGDPGPAAFELNRENGMRMYGSVYGFIPSNITFNSDIWNWSYMFAECNSLMRVPDIDTHNGANFSNMFYKCNQLSTIPEISTGNGTDFSYMFNFCGSGTTGIEVPAIDTHNGTDFKYMFAYSGIVNAPAIDVSKGTFFGSMFYYCERLKTVPPLDTHNGTSFSSIFGNCSVLERVEGIDFSNMTSSLSYSAWPSSNTTLTYLRLNGSVNASISFQNLRALDFDSHKSILEAASRTVNSNSKTLTFYSKAVSDPNGELAALVSACTSKGWTITGLTLN